LIQYAGMTHDGETKDQVKQIILLLVNEL